MGVELDWSAEALYGKAHVYIGRAQQEALDSPLFGFWTSLALELLCRSALAHIHPVLLADPTNEGNIQYAFGINPKGNPKSVHAKTVFARCSVFVDGFTDKMSGHCLIMADRRNAELHSGAAAFEGIDNSTWLPPTYEVMEVVLRHLGKSFNDFLGEGAKGAEAMLADRRDTRKREVQEALSAARKTFDALNETDRAEKLEIATARVVAWAQQGALRRQCACPACGADAAMIGEVLGRGPARIDEGEGAIVREVRVLPNKFVCLVCGLKLNGFQELNEAGLGSVYKMIEQEDPIEFFGIVPEEHVDIDELVQNYYDNGYQNE